MKFFSTVIYFFAFLNKFLDRKIENSENLKEEDINSEHINRFTETKKRENEIYMSNVQDRAERMSARKESYAENQNTFDLEEPAFKRSQSILRNGRKILFLDFDNHGKLNINPEAIEVNGHLY